MLRDLPPYRSTPFTMAPDEQALDDAQADRVYRDPMDDVFGSDSGSPIAHSSENIDEIDQRSAASERSDIPRLRSTHVTNGYRDGLAESKSRYVQEGFDEGYSLGAVLGTKAGWCLGVLEGISRAFSRSAANEATSQPSANVHKSLSDARKELMVQSLFGKNFFGPDGNWIYDVPGRDESEETTFQDVANAHPLIQKWRATIDGLAADLRLDLQRVAADKGQIEDD